jgi:HEAT repeat protein
MLLRCLRAAAFALCLCVPLAAQSEAGYNPNQRIQRIRDLAKRDPQAISTLAEYLSDPNRDIRIEAVKGIVKLDTERSLEPLARATHDKDSEVEIRATDGLVNYYLPGYVVKGGLTGSLTRGMRQVKTFFSSRNDQAIDPDVVIRPDVAQALADELIAASGTDARANAARAAGILRDHAAIPALTQALHSKDNETLFECLVALQKINDPTAAPGIVFLTHDLDDRIQATALDTIGLLHDADAAGDVRSALAHARNARVQHSALGALAMLGVPGDRTTFLSYAKNENPDLRAPALEGLGRLRDPADMPLLTDAYNEKNADWKVHLAAAFALVNEGKVDTAEFSPLPYLVENLDVKGRSGTAQAYLTELVRRGEMRRALFPLLPQATRDQKIALCAVFAESHDEDVIPVLKPMSKDIDSGVSMASARAIRIVETRKPPR